jgi:hypothetical protein
MVAHIECGNLLVDLATCRVGGSSRLCAWTSAPGAESYSKISTGLNSFKVVPRCLGVFYTVVFFPSNHDESVTIFVLVFRRDCPRDRA